MKHLSSVVAAVAIGLLIAACSSTPTTPLATASPAPPAAPSAVPATPTPSSTPAVTSPAPSAKPSPSATPAPVAFTAAEKRLVQALRADSRINCAPRRTDPPPLAVAGIECRLDTALVDRVGVYGFEGHLDASGKEVGTALEAYLDRLDQAGVQPHRGNCAATTAGDSSWPNYLPDEGDDGGLRAERSGCFVDAGMANVRLTCYDDIYMGVLGKTADVKALYAWSWRIAAGDDTHRDPPGLCAAPD